MMAASPNGKVRHASFGAAGQAASDIDQLAQSPHFELVAVADVDSRNFAPLKERFPGAKTFQDWRELLASVGDSIDSVNVTTPDHMHAPIAMSAMALGKHVYCQKPLTHTLHEARAMMLRAREKKVVTQMGIQVSSMFSERLAVHAVQDGAIGKVREVHTFSHKQWGDMDPVPERTSPVPEGFDWDGWLGVAASRPFIEGYYHPGEWRKRRDFGTGTLGDMGCHMFSGWFRALALGAPASVKSTGRPSNRHNWAIDGRVEYRFPGTEYADGDEVAITWTDGAVRPPDEVVAMAGGELPDQGTVYVGTTGVMVAPHTSTPQFFRDGKPDRSYRFPKLEPRDHYIEFIDACRAGGGKQPSANFDYASPMTEAVLLGCLASLFPGELLAWDSADLRFTNSDAATAEVRKTYRQGWEIEGL
jgi:predicted dehydrogenase